MHRFCLLCALLILMPAIAVHAERGPAAVPGFSFVTPKPLSGDFNSAMDTLSVMPDGKALFINREYDQAASTYRYRSYVIDQKGKVSGPTTIFSTYFGEGANVATVWIDGDGTAAGAAADYCLVYIMTFPYDTDERIGGLYTVRLNSKGKPLSAPKKIAGYTSAFSFRHPQVKAVREGDAVLVVLSMVEWQKVESSLGPRRAHMYLIQADLNGTATKITTVTLPKNGDYQQYDLFRPHWTGKRWFVPVAETLYVFNPVAGKYDKYKNTGNAMNLLAATPSGSNLKVTLKRFYQDNKIYGGFRCASFVPADGVSGAANATQTLVFGTGYYEENITKPLESVTTSLYLQTIGKKGSIKEKYRKVALPERKLTLTNYDPNLYWEDEGAGELSNVVLNSVGEPVIAIFRGCHISLKSDTSQKQWESEFGIYRIDLQKGTVALTHYANTGKLPTGYLISPWLYYPGGSLHGLALLNNYDTAVLTLFSVK